MILRCLRLLNVKKSNKILDKKLILLNFITFERSLYRNSFQKLNRSQTSDAAKYGLAIVLVTFSLSYLAVPIYRVYCQATGKGGKAFVDKAEEKVSKMCINKERRINVMFTADTNSRMSWNFKPTQSNIEVSPGETALAFFTAYNPLDIPVTGIATYSVNPYEAALYFNKIQCFCFEEQRLNPKEEVDLPVFFYIDPEYDEDPRLENVNDIVLSYTFFEANKGMKLPFSLNKSVT